MRFSLTFIISVGFLFAAQESQAAALEFPLLAHPEFFEDQLPGEHEAWNALRPSIEPLIKAKNVAELYRRLSEHSHDFGYSDVPIVPGSAFHDTTVDLHLKLIFRQLQAVAKADPQMLTYIYRKAIRYFNDDILLVAVAAISTDAKPSIDLDNENFILALGTLMESGNPQLEGEARIFQERIIKAGQGDELASLREFALDFIESRWGGDPRSERRGSKKLDEDVKRIKDAHVPPVIEAFRKIIADRAHLRWLLRANPTKEKVHPAARILKSLLTGETFVMGTDYPDYGNINVTASMVLGHDFVETSSRIEVAPERQKEADEFYKKMAKLSGRPEVEGWWPESERDEFNSLTVDELRRFLDFVRTSDPSEFSLPPQEPLLEYRQIQWIDKLIELTSWPESDEVNQEKIEEFYKELQNLANPYLELMMLSRLAKLQSKSGVLWRILFFRRLEEVAIIHPRDALQFFRMYMLFRYPAAQSQLAHDFVHEFKSQTDGFQNIRPDLRRKEMFAGANLPSEARQLLLIDSLFWSDQEIRERLREAKHFDLQAAQMNFGTGLMDLYQFTRTVGHMAEHGDLAEKPHPSVVLRRNWSWFVNRIELKPEIHAVPDFDKSAERILSETSPDEFLLLCRESELPDSEELYHLFAQLLLRDREKRGKFTDDVLATAISTTAIREELGEVHFERLMRTSQHLIDPVYTRLSAEPNDPKTEALKALIQACNRKH